jgi:hypothetical protein
MAELAQRLGLNLPNPFPGDIKDLTNFFQRFHSAIV